jgi:hypothetical protein
MSEGEDQSMNQSPPNIGGSRNAALRRLKRLSTPFKALLFFVVVALRSAIHAAPVSEVKLGKDTTYIMEPLAEDGLPNYALALLNFQKKGVSPQNNGAVLLWQAIGPKT